MKLAHKISLSFFVVALVLASVAATIFYSISKNSLQNAIFNDLVSTCASRSRHVETYLEMLEISVGQLSKSTLLENFLKINGTNDPLQNEAFKDAIKRLKRTKEANKSIYEFLLMDQTGKVVVSSSENNIGADKSMDALFLGAQKGVYIKDAYFLEPSQEPLMAVSVPFLDSQTGEFLGVLAARVRLTELNAITTEKIGPNKTGETYIVNKYGYMITPSRFLKDTFLKQEVDTENIRRARLHKDKEHALSEKELGYVFPDYRGVPVVGTHEYIPRMDWVVLTEIDAQEAFTPLARLRLTFFLILFIVPFTSWVLGMGVVRAIITGPLHRLHEGVEIIGNGNLDYRIGINERDEIGQLSRAFDAMAENLKNTTTSIESLNDEIYERSKVQEDAGNQNKALQEANKNLALNERALKNILYDLKKASDDLKASQSQLIHSEKLASVGQLAAGVAHEVKNPLAIILLAIESLEHTLGASNEKSSRYVTMVKEAAERANKVVVNLLNFSRQVQSHFEPLDIREVVGQTVSLVSNTARIKNINIVNRYDSTDELIIDGDAGQLGQVFLNLFSNAFDAVKSDGTVTVNSYLSKGAVETEDRIIVEISDTGQGIPKEIIPRIFEPFFTTKEQGAGTGLGLSTVYMILERHKGSINVKSTEGAGTTFTMTFPRYRG
ncbi:MAG TPA: ATP-binding protein [Candidatus Omnitrophota bacterium]|nr:ATP-binding protein [Candidatus Omnitrophota bacterium]HPD84739.1 ATP-binding protein [Candidatus Omnitrophota bacterium]HRZ03597.1 ATP-binding protein [Candidatus Omnitrophota bacterium]